MNNNEFKINRNHKTQYKTIYDMSASSYVRKKINTDFVIVTIFIKKVWPYNITNGTASPHSKYLYYTYLGHINRNKKKYLLGSDVCISFQYLI